MNYEKELNGFLEYAGHYDRTNGMIELKVVHTLRVALCTRCASRR